MVRDGNPSSSLQHHRPSQGFAVVTGASSGIGRELAKRAAAAGFDLVLAADEPRIHDVAVELRQTGSIVDAMCVDLSTTHGVDDFVHFVKDLDRPVDLLIANAGIDHGGALVETDLSQTLAVIDTNIRGSVSVIHQIAQRMGARGAGKILVTASIVSVLPGPFHATYCASKAFLYSFSQALRYEMKETGVSVTCLMPGVTETGVYERAGMQDTWVGRSRKADPAYVARVAFDALLSGKAVAVPGILNKIITGLAVVAPVALLTAIHAAATRPRKFRGTG
ncbi:SDR family NAD(P)-dependent oxidoreductase [Neorhizobium sp. BT27B]|uniref:SDR family NAD(P)-dependent oxidoreductase n=1 Tax=Neorhizobium sp. BT27B TaxID=3142625 RepID=UPI003D2E2864